MILLRITKSKPLDTARQCACRYSACRYSTVEMFAVCAAIGQKQLGVTSTSSPAANNMADKVRKYRLRRRPAGIKCEEIPPGYGDSASSWHRNNRRRKRMAEPSLPTDAD